MTGRPEGGLERCVWEGGRGVREGGRGMMERCGGILKLVHCPISRGALRRIYMMEAEKIRAKEDREVSGGEQRGRSEIIACRGGVYKGYKD